MCVKDTGTKYQLWISDFNIDGEFTRVHPFYSIHRLNHFPINFKITKYDWRIYTKSKKEKVKPQT